MKIAIIDDVLECRNEIQVCLHRFFSNHYESLCVTEFSGGEVFLSSFQKSDYDLIFIDQYMQGCSGIDTARQIRRVHYNQPGSRYRKLSGKGRRICAETFFLCGF